MVSSEATRRAFMRAATPEPPYGREGYKTIRAKGRITWLWVHVLGPTGLSVHVRRNPCEELRLGRVGLGFGFGVSLGLGLGSRVGGKGKVIDLRVTHIRLNAADQHVRIISEEDIEALKLLPVTDDSSGSVSFDVSNI